MIRSFRRGFANTQREGRTGTLLLTSSALTTVPASVWNSALRYINSLEWSLIRFDSCSFMESPVRNSMATIPSNAYAVRLGVTTKSYFCGCTYVGSKTRPAVLSSLLLLLLLLLPLLVVVVPVMFTLVGGVMRCDSRWIWIIVVQFKAWWQQDRPQVKPIVSDARWRSINTWFTWFLKRFHKN